MYIILPVCLVLELDGACETAEPEIDNGSIVILPSVDIPFQLSVYCHIAMPSIEGKYLKLGLSTRPDIAYAATYKELGYFLTIEDVLILFCNTEELA
ncbi:hypothetical protein LHEJCM20397_15300 [Lactobacillus helveticus]|nr:hypothetical protein LHEJCM20397_15300 [Lactobacillus helveticus]